MAFPAPPPYQRLNQHSLRQDMWNVGLQIAGNSYGIWDKKTGGEMDSDEVTYYPGGMEPRLSLGGRQLPGNVTLQKLYDGVDEHTRVHLLLRGCGRAKAVITQRPLDLDGNPYGRKVVWTGKLKRVLVPDVDSEATAAAMIEVEITVETITVVDA